MSSVVWQSLSSSKLPALYSNDNSFAVSPSYSKFINNDAHKSSSAVDNFKMRIITNNDTVRIEKSSLPITVIEKAKQNTKIKDDSSGAEKLVKYNYGNDHVQEPLLDALSWTYDKDDRDKKKNKRKRHTKKHKHKFGHGGGHGGGGDKGSAEKYCNGKEHKHGHHEMSHKEYMMPMMIGVMTAKAVILPIVLKMLAIFSMKGFFLSILAIIIGSVLALKKMSEPHHSHWERKDHGGDTKVEIIPVPVHENYHHYTKHDEVIHDGQSHHPFKSYY